MESNFATNICAISGWRNFMMQLVLTLAAIIAFAGAAFADPLEGTWRRPIYDNGNSGLVVVAPCGASLCGTLSQSFDSSGAQMAWPNIGRQIIFDTTPSGDGAYRGQVRSGLVARPRQNLQFALAADRRYAGGIWLCVRYLSRWRRMDPQLRYHLKNAN